MVDEALIDPEGRSAFKIEQHGIDYIPPEDRHGVPKQQFWIWCAALFAAINFVIGAVVTSLGLSIPAGLAAVVIGDVSFLLVGTVALAGPAAGTSTIVISRSAFGVKGNVLTTFFSWATIVGWECVNSVLGVLIFVQLLDTIGLGDGTVIKLISTVVYIGVLAVLAVFGHATIVKINPYITWLLAAGFVGVLYFGLKAVDWSYTPKAPATGSSVTTFIWAVTIVAAAQGFGYVNMGADYTRYLPKSSNRRAIIGWTALGAFIPATITQGAGVIIGTKLNMFDPVGSLSNVMPGWFLAIFLVIMAITMVTVNVLNTYSSGLNLLALGLKAPRYISVLFDVALIFGFVLLALFAWNYIDTFTNFLSLSLWWLAPWAGVFISDMLLRRFDYLSPDLFKTDGGRYFFSGGFNWRAYLAFAVGSAGAVLCTNSTLFKGPIAKAMNGLDLSIVAGLLLSSVVYLVSMRPVVARGRAIGGGTTSHRAAEVG